MATYSENFISIGGDLAGGVKSALGNYEYRQSLYNAQARQASTASDLFGAQSSIAQILNNLSNQTDLLLLLEDV